MQNEFIIGQSGNQPFKINSDGVSGQHAKLKIDDDKWVIEDLNSSNGTYIRDENGNFQRIFKKIINENTVIRLGIGGHHSFTFMAHRVLSNEGDYSYEFSILKRLQKEQIEAESNQESINIRNNWIAKCSGIVAIILCSLAGLFIDISPNARYVAIAFAPIIIGVIFKNDSIKLKDIKNRRKNLIVCPKCGRPLTDFEVENMQCLSCKAK